MGAMPCAEALDLMSCFSVQFAVFSVGAINARLGQMLHGFEEANIARNAQVNIVVTVSDKLGKRVLVVLNAFAVELILP